MAAATPSVRSRLACASGSRLAAGPVGVVRRRSTTRRRSSSPVPWVERQLEVALVDRSRRKRTASRSIRRRPRKTKTRSRTRRPRNRTRRRRAGSRHYRPFNEKSSTSVQLKCVSVFNLVRFISISLSLSSCYHLSICLSFFDVVVCGHVFTRAHFVPRLYLSFSTTVTPWHFNISGIYRGRRDCRAVNLSNAYYLFICLASSYCCVSTRRNSVYASDICHNK